MKALTLHMRAHKKRDHIINQMEEMGSGQTERMNSAISEAIELFDDYLHRHEKRCTVERHYVVEGLYRQKGPIDIETLHNVVCKNHGNIALTTIYTNLALMVDAGLAHRLDLADGKMAFFEPTIGVEPHGYIICKYCGHIESFKVDGQLDSFIDNAPKRFKVLYTDLQIIGLCHKCQDALRQQEKRARQRRKEESEAKAKAKAKAKAEAEAEAKARAEAKALRLAKSKERKEKLEAALARMREYQRQKREQK